MTVGTCFPASIGGFGAGRGGAGRVFAPAAGAATEGGVSRLEGEGPKSLGIGPNPLTQRNYFPQSYKSTFLKENTSIRWTTPQ